MKYFGKSQLEESFDSSYKKRTSDYGPKKEFRPTSAEVGYYPRKRDCPGFDYTPFLTPITEIENQFSLPAQKAKTLLELEEEKLHSKTKRRQNPEKGRQVCKFWAAGNCKFGDSCRFAHPGMAEQKRGLRRQQFLEEVKTFYSASVPESMKELDESIKRINKDLKKIDETFGYSKKFQIGKTPKSVDIMFIIDCTYSMGPWIEASKTQMKAIIEQVKAKFNNIQTRLSVIGYRDLTDTVPMLIFDFDKDINKGIRFISELKPYGGGDLPEDVAGGLFEGLMQHWESEVKYAILIADAPPHGKQYQTLHGGNFHDTYPNGDPKGRKVEELIESYAKRGIFFNAIKITQYTDVFFNIINEHYKKISKRDIPIQNLGTGPVNLQAFQTFVTNTISQSISNSTQIESSSLGHKLLSLSSKGEHQMVDNAINAYKKYQQKLKSGAFNSHSLGKSSSLSKSKSKAKEEEESKYGAIKEEDEIKEVEEEEDDDQEEGKEKEEEEVKDEEEILKELEEFEKKQKLEEEAKEEKEEERKVEFKVKELGFTRRQMQEYNVVCHTYSIVKEEAATVDWRKPILKYCKMTSRIQMAVEPFADGAMRYAFFARDLVDNRDQVAKIPKKLTKKNYGHASMKKEIETMITCNYIVKDFNDRILLSEGESALTEFVDAFIYEFTDPGVEYQWAYGENFIKGIYQKYNNNAGWASSQSSLQVKVAQALSHFSWQLTQGYLLISDLQGVGSILTDPQIHCLDQSRFGSGNLGLYGILLFFDTHICNDFCKKLNLLHPRKANGLPQNFDSLENLDFTQIVETSSRRAAKKTVNKLCELCREAKVIKHREFMHLRVKGKEFWCKECYEKIKESEIAVKCRTCREEFKASWFYQRMKKMDLQTQCQSCTES